MVSKFADSLLRQIVETNCHKYIGFPDKVNLDEFSRVYKIFENNLQNMPQPVTMVCSLLHNKDEVNKN